MASDDDPELDAWLERIENSAAFAQDSWIALTARDRERFRQFRHGLPELVNDTVRQSGALKMNTDFAVTLDRNREMLAYYRRRLERIENSAAFAQDSWIALTARDRERFRQGDPGVL